MTFSRAPGWLLVAPPKNRLHWELPRLPPDRTSPLRRLVPTGTTSRGGQLWQDGAKLQGGNEHVFASVFTHTTASIAQRHGEICNGEEGAREGFHWMCYMNDLQGPLLHTALITTAHKYLQHRLVWNQQWRSVLLTASTRIQACYFVDMGDMHT